MITANDLTMDLRFLNGLHFTPAEIMQAVCAACKVTRTEVESKCRRRDIADARHLYHYLVYNIGWNADKHECHQWNRRYMFCLKEVGLVTGRDHATVLASNKVCEWNIVHNQEFHNLYRLTVKHLHRIDKIKTKNIKDDVQSECLADL